MLNCCLFHAWIPIQTAALSLQHALDFGAVKQNPKVHLHWCLESGGLQDTTASPICFNGCVYIAPILFYSRNQVSQAVRKAAPLPAGGRPAPGAACFLSTPSLPSSFATASKGWWALYRTADLGQEWCLPLHQRYCKVRMRVIKSVWGALALLQCGLYTPSFLPLQKKNKNKRKSGEEKGESITDSSTQRELRQGLRLARLFIWVAFNVSEWWCQQFLAGFLAQVHTDSLMFLSDGWRWRQSLAPTCPLPVHLCADVRAGCCSAVLSKLQNPS